MFHAGERVGDYEIVAKLRSGGMATLFLGRRTGAAGFAKHVAIKVVHEHLAEDPVFVRMFVDEALLSSRIEHPNVVHVEELRERDGHHFLVMEYVHGCSLWQLLGVLGKLERRLAPELAVHIAARIADGLHAAHETRDRQGNSLGVVHRDVSPQNVLLAYQGNIKLIDFGVAKVRGRLADDTQGGSIKGKFRYMAPEQARGEDVDRRTDVYALGVVLWEMLTMRRRFEGRSDSEILDLARCPTFVPPSTIASDVPEALDRVVEKALAVDPDARYQTAHAFRQALFETTPKAALMHESELAGLLKHVMAERIAKDASALPESVTGLLESAPGSGASGPSDRPLETLTLSAVGGKLLVDDDTDPSGVPAAVTKMVPTEGDISVLETSKHPSQPPREGSSRILLAVALAAGAIAVFLLGVVIVLGLEVSSEPEPATQTVIVGPTASPPAVTTPAVTTPVVTTPDGPAPTPTPGRPTNPTPAGTTHPAPADPATTHPTTAHPTTADSDPAAAPTHPTTDPADAPPTTPSAARTPTDRTTTDPASSHQSVRAPLRPHPPTSRMGAASMSRVPLTNTF